MEETPNTIQPKETDEQKTQEPPKTTEVPENEKEAPATEPEPTAEPEDTKGEVKADKPEDSKEDKKKKPREKSEPDKRQKGSAPEENPDFKYMIRVANTNIDGNFIIPQGLTSIKGIGIRLGIGITDRLGLPRNKKIGDMTDDEVDRLINIVDNLNDEFPGWMMNRQKDFETGENLHIVSAETDRVLRDDLNRLKKIRCYRGIRHEQGQKVRGQRTRANGRSGMTVGVMKKRVRQQQIKASGKSTK